MSISKSQLEAIASGVLDKFGEVYTPELEESGVLKDMLVGIAQGVVDALRVSATEKGVVASKSLRSSLNTRDAVQDGDMVTVTIEGDESWVYAEYGRRAGKFPPLKNIEEWITAKGISLRQNKGESTRTVLQRRKSMAFAIARKIAAKGTIKRFGYKGSGFIKSVVNKRNMELIAEVLGEMYGKKIILYIQAKNDNNS